MEATTEQRFKTGMHIANALEAISGKVNEDHTVQNWDNKLGYNIYEGKESSEVVDEFVRSGATETELGLLVEGIRNSYPETEKRPNYVDEVLKSIENKLNPEN